MKAIVKGTKGDGEDFNYILEDIISVNYSNENLVIIFSNGTSVSYKNAINNGYKYQIVFM